MVGELGEDEVEDGEYRLRRHEGEKGVVLYCAFAEGWYLERDNRFY